VAANAHRSRANGVSSPQESGGIAHGARILEVCNPVGAVRKVSHGLTTNDNAGEVRLSVGSRTEAKMQTVLNQHIDITPGVAGGKPRIAGHRITVQNIVVWHERMGLGADEIATEHGLTLSDVYAALAYYYDHHAEIDEFIHADEEFVAELPVHTFKAMKRSVADRNALHGRVCCKCGHRGLRRRGVGLNGRTRAQVCSKESPCSRIPFVQHSALSALQMTEGQRPKVSCDRSQYVETQPASAYHELVVAQLPGNGPAGLPTACMSNLPTARTGYRPRAISLGSGI
jgi:uncharacterized protein (DUF433 family)